MTGPTDGWFCTECGIHRTRSAGSLCPVCSDEKSPPAPAPRMALDPRPATISTTAGELL